MFSAVVRKSPAICPPVARDEKLPRYQNSTVRVKVEVNAIFIRQSGLDLSGHVIGEHLIAVRFDCAQRLPN
jgi:hypothetical protein